MMATSWDFNRKPWVVQSGGSGSKVFKTTDGGLTWKEIAKGLPKLKGKMGISPAGTKLRSGDVKGAKEDHKKVLVEQLSHAPVKLPKSEKEEILLQWYKTSIKNAEGIINKYIESEND
mgnify:CR=1 FL=1